MNNPIHYHATCGKDLPFNFKLPGEDIVFRCPRCQRLTTENNIEARGYEPEFSLALVDDVYIITRLSDVLSMTIDPDESEFFRAQLQEYSSTQELLAEYFDANEKLGGEFDREI